MRRNSRKRPIVEEEVPSFIARRRRLLGPMPPLTGRNPNKTTVLISVVPLNVVSSRGSKETGGLYPFPAGVSEWASEVDNRGLVNTHPDEWWLDNVAAYRFAEQIEIFYDIYEEDGYWCRMPERARIHRPPPGYIGVYTRMLQYGAEVPTS